jgi:hypothetical protein
VGTAFKNRHSPYQHVSAQQVTGLGITAYNRFHPPIITNANDYALEEGLVSYDQDSERLCYTDSNLIWRCAAVTDDLVGLTRDSMSAMLLVNNQVVSTSNNYTVPTTAYKRLVNWTTSLPRVPSASWSNATGYYTAAVAGVYNVQAQVSWIESERNQGIRVLRIIHTSLLLVTTIMCETVSNPSSNKNVNTIQNATAGVTVAIGETLHIEVAQTSGIPKTIEGGATLGSSGTVLQITQVK